jgi:hypothetical protein
MLNDRQYSRCAQQESHSHRSIVTQSWLVAIHLLSSTALLYCATCELWGNDSAAPFIGGLVLYGAVILMLLLSITDLSVLSCPAGVFFGFSYFAYYIKSVVYLYGGEMFFKNWITIQSPLGNATQAEWGTASLAFGAGTILIATGYWLSTHCMRQGRAVVIPVQCSAERNAKRKVHLLLWTGLALTFLRVIVTAFLGYGASFGGSETNLGVPGLGGFLQFFTMWGGRTAIAGAFAYALTARMPWAMACAAIEALCLGGLATISTGSKSELLLPLVILALTAFFLRRAVSSRVLTLWAAMIGISLLTVMYAYPAFHNYRYVRNEVGILDYLVNSSSEMGFYAGGEDILRRLNGLEYLTLVVTHFKQGGGAAPLAFDYQPFILEELFGISASIQLGLGIGCFGGLLMIGGWSLYPVLCVITGMLIKLIEALVVRCMDTPELQAAGLSVIAIWVTFVLMFAGDIAFSLKEAITIGFSFVCLRKSISTIDRPHALLTRN